MTDWQRDLEDARATIEELTRERDSAKEAEAWVRDQLRLIAESDAVRIEELTRERDEATALAERWRRDAIEDVPSSEVLVDIRALLGLKVGQSTIQAVRHLVAEVERLSDLLPPPVTER
jgi:hypothetical protein